MSEADIRARSRELEEERFRLKFRVGDARRSRIRSGCA